MGITYAEAMETIHAILPDGQVGETPMRVGLEGLEGDNMFFHLDADTMSPPALGNDTVFPPALGNAHHHLSHDSSPSGDFRH